MKSFKWFLGVFIVVSLLGVFCFGLLVPAPPNASPDAAAVNDIVQTISKDWGTIVSGGELPKFSYPINYTLLDENNELVTATRKGISESLDAALQNRDSVVDINHKGALVGKVVFHNDSQEAWQNYRNNIIIFVGVFSLFLAFAFAAYGFYLWKTIISPFKKLNHFAREVAAGNLEAPLPMDKKNIFGAFSESFDILREELAISREKEREASQSKKELVASLSHDIKTPVASIKAVSELMLVSEQTEKTEAQIKTILGKADQIDHLITELFHATMEDLQQLKVNCAPLPSTELVEIIRRADYENRAIIAPVPECLLSVDALRLYQTIENIISNSYKYAGTEINVSAHFSESSLVLTIKDSGAGVSPDELPLLAGKYYRGLNADKKQGYGLGLYLARYFMKKMGGELQFESHNGFTAQLQIPILKD